MDYDEALKAVIQWCEREDMGVNRKYLLDACVSDYAQDLARRKTQRAADQEEKRLRYTIPEEMMQMEVAKLTTARLEDWLHGLDVTKSSANRTLAVLRAALNLAFRRGIVPTDREWKRVQAYRKADKRRELFLTDDQVEKLLNAAETPALRDLLKAGILTGARYGELRNAKAKDLDIGNRSLKLDGKTGARDCYLSTDALRFFKQQAKSKLPEAPLLMNEDGDAWNRWEHTRKVKRAVKRAELPPETVFSGLDASRARLVGVLNSDVAIVHLARECWLEARCQAAPDVGFCFARSTGFLWNYGVNA